MRAGRIGAKSIDMLCRYERSYFWRVQATSAGGVGPWSVAQSFTTREAPPRRYYRKDYLGSVRAVVDAAGDPVERRDYSPFIPLRTISCLLLVGP